MRSDSGIAQLLKRLKLHQLVARQVELRNGAVTLTAAGAKSVLAVSGDVLTTIHGPRWRLLIIGAGQMSRFLGQIAVGLDYRVTVCDPRKEFRSGCDTNDIELTTEMPDDVALAMKRERRSAVVALTHDPKLDDLALMVALKSPAFMPV